jgi:transcriptional regulator with AAA-type ATPase domain/tetratricopeptide (TPR) repeat protein
MSSEHGLYGEFSLGVGTALRWRGLFREALRSFEDAAAAFRRDENPAGVARALKDASLVLRTMGHLGRAREVLTDARTAQGRVFHARFEVAYWISLSVLDFAAGDLPRAEVEAEKAVKLAKKHGIAQGLARALLAKGRASTGTRDSRHARMDLEAARGIALEHGFQRELGISHEFLGDLARAQGDWATARAEWEKALEIGERIAPAGDLTGEPERRLAEAELHAAIVTQAAGAQEESARLFAAALRRGRHAFRVNRSCGDRKEEASTLRVLGDIARARGRATAAQRAYEVSIAMLDLMGARGELALSQQALADLTGVPTPDDASAPRTTGSHGGPPHVGGPHAGARHFGAAPAQLSSPQEGQGAGAKKPRRPVRGRRPSIFAAGSADSDTLRESDGATTGGSLSAGTPGSAAIDPATLIPLDDDAPPAGIAFTLATDGRAFATSDPGVRLLIDQLREVAPSNGTVLLLGETGTGKELLARFVHEQSGRRGPFLAANASAFPETLVESELFGHVKGAFTSAAGEKVGLIEAAHGGTFFLDEVGDLPLPTQAKLLRSLEDRSVRRVGSTQTRAVDVRFIAATNVDLKEAMNAGQFRQDLYYRLSVHGFRIPPLRERGDDVVGLARHLLARRARERGRSVRAMEAGVEAALRAYPWPGNVRELDNELQRAVARIGAEDVLRLAHLSAELQAGANGDPSGGLFHDVALLERRRIESALEATAGNQARAAVQLGMSRQALRYKLIRYGIHPARKR